MDDAAQPEVIDATRDFLRLNPSLESALVWQEGQKARCANIFEYDGNAACFAAIQVNKLHIRPNKSYTYCAFGYPSPAVGKLSGSFHAARKVSGSVSLNIHFRALPNDSLTTSEMFDIHEQHEISVVGREDGSFEIESKLVLPERAVNHVVWVDISLRFITGGDDGFGYFALNLNGKTLKMGRNFWNET
jgi:hypothetical protein